ncbi:MAG: hypothetical protein PHI11_15470 [Gallionella sp.]|nr:hypothetical protein [Gallionella sp.]
MSEFAVRWRLGGLKDFNERMSLWHISSDGDTNTLCGIMVPVIYQKSTIMRAIWRR